MSVLTPTVLGQLRTLALSFTKEQGVAEVIVEESIVKFAERVDPDKVGPGKVLAYLRMIVRNKCLSWLRHINLERDYLRISRETPIRSAFAEAISHEAEELFDKVVARLPKAWARVIILRVIHQLSFDQIAKKLRIKQGTALSRFWRAKQCLEDWVKYVEA